MRKSDRAGGDSSPGATQRIGELRDKILRKCRESTATKERFFRDNADRIAACCTAMSKAFDVGARLYVMGSGGSACDAQHMAVEFMHPIVEKRPALPAMALTTDAAMLTAVANDDDFALAFATQLRVLARKGDIALGISTSGKSPAVLRALEAARDLGLLTIGFSGRDGGKLPEVCDFCFTVPSYTVHRIRETHEMLVHLIWDIVQVIRGHEDVI